MATATWTDGSTTEVDLADVEITGFDTNQRGEQTVTLAYGAAKVTITVTVLLPAGKDITVSFMLLGDSAHGDSGDKHTLADNNLETWIDTTKVTVSNNATVLDVILDAVSAHGNGDVGLKDGKGAAKAAAFINPAELDQLQSLDHAQELLRLGKGGAHALAAFS